MVELSYHFIFNNCNNYTLMVFRETFIFVAIHYNYYSCDVKQLASL